jgi:hypothetical protein
MPSGEAGDISYFNYLFLKYITVTPRYGRNHPAISWKSGWIICIQAGCVYMDTLNT